MKKYILPVLLTILCVSSMSAQSFYKTVGYCGEDVKWSFDGYTL